MYSEDCINELYYKLDENMINFNSMLVDLYKASGNCQSDKSKEHLKHGVMRRLKILSRSVENIFNLLPPTQKTPLDSETLSDVQINLHAFFININGLVDNLAWCCAYESNNKTLQNNKYNVGLFKQKTQNILGPSLKGLIQSEPIKHWHEEYSKNFRDALAHRIPMYIPPALLSDRESEEHRSISLEINSLDMCDFESYQKMNELKEQQSKLGSPSFLFTHSFNENSKKIYIHPQLLSDMATVLSILRAYLKDCAHALPKNTDNGN